MTNNIADSASNSGPILKAAREELSLSIEHVAHQLHLRPSVVKAIEDEDYDELPNDVFLKGYFRSYCRIVNLHDARMMALLDQQLLKRKHAADLELQEINKSNNIKKRKKLFITCLVFLICVALIASIYYFISANTSKDVLNPSQAITTNLTALDESNEAIKPEIDIPKVDIKSPETLSNLALKDSSDIALKPLITGNLETEQTVSKQKDTEQAVSVSIESDEPIKSAIKLDDIQPNLDISSESVLSVIFKGDCWFKLTDSTGRVVVADLKQKDENVSFTGKAPFNIVIGDASQVTMTLNNEIIDLGPHSSSNGRAELTLNPLKTSTEG